MNLSHLGEPIGPMIRIHGGFANRMCRLDTDRGLSGELGSTALSVAKGPGLDAIEPAVFRSVLDGYVAGGGALPPSGPSWFVSMIGGWLGHTRWNILRCLGGVEAGTGPDLALSHESAR